MRTPHSLRYQYGSSRESTITNYHQQIAPYFSFLFSVIFLRLQTKRVRHVKLAETRVEVGAPLLPALLLLKKISTIWDYDPNPLFSGPHRYFILVNITASHLKIKSLWKTFYGNRLSLCAHKTGLTSYVVILHRSHSFFNHIIIIHTKMTLKFTII